MAKMKRSEAQELMNKLLAMNESKEVDFDSVELDSASYSEVEEKIVSLEENKSEKYGVAGANRAILDGILDYQKEHGHLPDAGVVAEAVNFANEILDSAIEGNGVTNTNPEHFTVMEPIVGIRSFIATAIPFATVIPAEKKSGEGSIVIVSHHAGKTTGQYKEGASLNGVAGGNVYISTERTHILTTSNRRTYSGKITNVQETWETCDQEASVSPLSPNSTQVFINGLLVIDGTDGKGDTEESATGYITLDQKYLITAEVNILTGEVTVKADKELPEQTEVLVTGCLNTEKDEFLTPSVTVKGTQHNFHAKWWCTDVSLTKEAATQFQNEIGISPLFEGVIAVRKQLQAETLFKLISRLTKIGKEVNASEFDFDWTGDQGANKSSSDIAKELVNQIGTVSKKMAKQNGSHGVSHIYVGDKMASILQGMGDNYFQASGLKPRPDVYRLGRLKTLDIDVYYSPKGVYEDEYAEMLLIGANPQDVTKNPVVLGEPTPPFTTPLTETTNNKTHGYRVRGQHIVALNPVPEYQQSAAVIKCTNLPL